MNLIHTEVPTTWWQWNDSLDVKAQRTSSCYQERPPFAANSATEDPNEEKHWEESGYLTDFHQCRVSTDHSGLSISDPVPHGLPFNLLMTSFWPLMNHHLLYLVLLVYTRQEKCTSDFGLHTLHNSVRGLVWEVTWGHGLQSGLLMLRLYETLHMLPNLSLGFCICQKELLE